MNPEKTQDGRLVGAINCQVDSAFEPVSYTHLTLTVLDKDGNVVDTWTSDAKEAHVIKRLVVGEIYTLREEFAPYGYLNATDIQFTVEDTGKVQHVEMKDEVPTGSIVINKDGEFVT